MHDQSAGSITQEIHAIDPPIRYTLARGMLGVSTPQAYARLIVGAGLWLVGPPLLARACGRCGWQRAQHAVERWWSRRLARHLAIRLEIDGLEQLDPTESYIVAPLHEGFADVVALFHLPIDLRFTARDELFGWRFVGGTLRDTGQIYVAPERGSWSYRQLLRSARTVVARGESVVVFPQGTILGIETDFQIGAFALAQSLDRPILPVALTGSHRVWEHPYTPRLRYGQRISLRILPPIPAATVRALPADDLRRHIQRKIKSVALSGALAPPRYFVPARDGYWDGFAYRIDPDFAALAADVAQHRAAIARQQTLSAPSPAV